ncbi:D-inositol 3-phosphate glycosyltransferase [compost metagenome]
MSDRVLFTGQLSDLRIFYNSIDVFAFPSLIEPFGLVLLEALACERPVIASNTGGIREILERLESGIRVPVGDSGAIVAAISEMMARPPSSAERIATRKRIQAEYSLDTLINRYLMLYEELFTHERSDLLIRSHPLEDEPK